MILKRKLLKVLSNNKVDVCFDFFETSGHGHKARMQNFVKFYELDVMSWFSYPEAVYTISKKAQRDHVLLIDSFIIKNIAIGHLSKLYKHVVLIDDGPIRPKWPNVTKINWEPARHLVKRFHLANDMISDFSLFPIIETSVEKPNKNTLFAYFSSDTERLINSILEKSPLNEFENIILIGENVMNIPLAGATKYTNVDSQTFDKLFASAGTILTAGGNTFYRGLKQKKNIIIYMNSNIYVDWERRTARYLGYNVIHA